MSTALLITTDDKFEEVEFENNLDCFYKHIKTDMVEIANPRALHHLTGLSNNFIMVCDEEALLKANPKMNIFASTFRGATIYGNVMIVKDNGEDFEGLEKEDHAELSAAIAKLLDMLERQYFGE